MGEVRRATARDAEELTRLRGVLLASQAGAELPEDGWRQAVCETFRARLAEPEPRMAAFVVDQPDRPGLLAACVVGALDFRVGGPGNHSGVTGYIFSVATDPGHRRRGYFRQCMAALLDWYGERGVTTVDLRASAMAESHYRALGFVRVADPSMRLRLT